MTESELLVTPPDRPYAAPIGAVLAALSADPSVGLTGAEAARRLKQFGPNELLIHPPVTAAMILLNQLKGPVVWLLASAAAIAGLFGEWTEAIAILLVLGINTAIGFTTELRAVRSMEALRKLGSRASRVLRDGKLAILPAEKVVPGDVVALESGDVVTADMRLIEANTLACDELTLTGELVPVEKQTHRRSPRTRSSPTAPRWCTKAPPSRAAPDLASLSPPAWPPS